MPVGKIPNLETTNMLAKLVIFIVPNFEEKRKRILARIRSDKRMVMYGRDCHFKMGSWQEELSRVGSP